MKEADYFAGWNLPKKIDFFFAPPLPEQVGDNVSPLHLVRREMQDCLIGGVISEDQVISSHMKRHRLFATTMVIMAGIDLLAKFYAGSDANNEAGKRIIDFVSEFMFKGHPSTKDCAEALYYGCRNPLLHSFTLHSGKKYSVALTSFMNHGIVGYVDGVPGLYLISVEGLFLGFVKAIQKYESSLRGSADLQSNFGSMFNSYGSIGIR